MNVFEETSINKTLLPEPWQKQSVLDDFEKFLQLNWEQRTSFYDDESHQTKQQFLEFRNNQAIRFNNYIGTIVFKGEKINIFPKIFRTDMGDYSTDGLSLDHLLKNLIQWINYCNRVNYPYINIMNDIENCDNLKDLFINVFVKYLNHAFKRNSYYRFEEREEDCSSIKGKIDVNDYFNKKIANGKFDKFLCDYSEFEFDNLLNRIIKCTCKNIINDTTPKNKKELKNIIIKLNDVTDMKCIPSDCDKIKLSKMNNHYKLILNMCKVFLLNKVSTFNTGTTDSFCFFFLNFYLKGL